MSSRYRSCELINQLLIKGEPSSVKNLSTAICGPIIASRTDECFQRSSKSLVRIGRSTKTIHEAAGAAKIFATRCLLIAMVCIRVTQPGHRCSRDYTTRKVRKKLRLLFTAIAETNSRRLEDGKIGIDCDKIHVSRCSVVRSSRWIGN